MARIPTFIRRFAPLRARHVVIALSAFALLNATVWSLSVTEGIAPDEQAHFAVAKHIAVAHKIPEFGDEGFGVYILDIAGRDGSRLSYPYLSYASQPPLPYVLSAVFIALPTDSTWMDYRQARTSQALMAAMFPVILYLGMLAMFPGRSLLAVTAAAWGAMWPQITYLSAYLNADLATTVSCAALIAAWFYGARNAWRTRDAALLGLLMGIAAMCKLNAYLLIATSLVVALLTLRGPIRSVLARLGVALLTFSLSVSWWLAMAIDRYGLDILARDRGRELAADLGATATKLDGASSGWTYWHLLTSTGYKRNISLTGILGLPNHFPSPGVKILVGASVGLAVFGLGVALVRRIARRRRGVGRSWWARLREDPTMRVHLLVLLLFPVFVFSISYNAFKNDIYFLAQGRYLFPMFLPFVAYLTWGFAGILGGRLERLLLAGFAGVMLLANLVALERDVILYYGRGLRSWLEFWQGPIVIAWALSIVAVVALFTRLAWRGPANEPSLVGSTSTPVAAAPDPIGAPVR